MNKTIKILPNSNHELEYIYQLEKQISSSPWSKKSLVNYLQDKNHFSLAIKQTAENIIVSYLFYSQVCDEITIDKIGTNPDFQKKGYASSLLYKILLTAQTNYIKTIFLEVSEKNMRAQSLYRKTGFNKYHYRKKYYQNGDNAILMKMNLQEHSNEKDKISGNIKY